MGGGVGGGLGAAAGRRSRIRDGLPACDAGDGDLISRHCEERSDEAIQLFRVRHNGLFRCARNDGFDYRSRGSRASRRPSPTKLNDSTTRKIAKPGHIAIHGAVVKKRCAAFSMLPQEGAGGCWPRPKNDNAASAMMAAAIDNVACTNRAGMMFGKI